MTIKDIFKVGIWMTISSLMSMIIMSMIILYFRFKNPLLRRELILFMQEGDVSYWCMFIIIDILLLLVFIGLYFYNSKKIKRGIKK